MKPVARLTGTILARKGFAAPSTGLLPEPGDLDHIVEPDPNSSFGQQEHVAKADRSKRQPIQLKTGLSKPSMEASIPAAYAEPAVKKKHKSKQNKARRIAMTVRMNKEQHRKLKTFCAHHRKSAQKAIMEAIGSYLARHDSDEETADAPVSSKVARTA